MMRPTSLVGICLAVLVVACGSDDGDDAGDRAPADRTEGSTQPRGEEDPPPKVFETFRLIADYELPIQLLEKPHPSALVPPDQRRDLKRGD